MSGPELTCGLLLAGGASRRMGADKRYLVFDGDTLLRRAAMTLQQVCQSVLVLGVDPDDDRAMRELPPGVTVCPDRDPGAGPLSAIADPVSRVTGRAVVMAVDLPCVTPALLRFLLAELDQADARRGKVGEEVGEGHGGEVGEEHGGGPTPDAVIPIAEGRMQVTCSTMRSPVGRFLIDALAAGETSLQRALATSSNGGCANDPAFPGANPVRRGKSPRAESRRREALRLQLVPEARWQTVAAPQAFFNVNTPADLARLRALEPACGAQTPGPRTAGQP